MSADSSSFPSPAVRNGLGRDAAHGRNTVAVDHRPRDAAPRAAVLSSGSKKAVPGPLRPRRQSLLRRAPLLQRTQPHRRPQRYANNKCPPCLTMRSE